MDAYKAICRIFGERNLHHLFDRLGNSTSLTGERRRSRHTMLEQHISGWPDKRCMAAEPFIDNDRERILIAGGTRSTESLFRCSIRRGPKFVVQKVGIIGSCSDTEIAEQDMLILNQEQIFGFDIAMDVAKRMCVL